LQTPVLALLLLVPPLVAGALVVPGPFPALASPLSALPPPHAATSRPPAAATASKAVLSFIRRFC